MSVLLLKLLFCFYDREKQYQLMAQYQTIKIVYETCYKCYTFYTCRLMLYFIRHAESVFNYQADIKLKAEMGQKFSKKSTQYQSLKFDPRFADCSLTENGKQQCLKAKKQMQQIDVKLVLVSPMRRALQTCQIVFKDHPSNPKIVVDPNVREIFSSSCDIGSRLIESKQQFKHFDFGKIEQVETWYIKSIKNQEVRKMLEQKLELRIKQEKVQKQERVLINKIAFEVMLEYLKSAYGKINQYSLSNFEAQKQRLRQIAEEHKSIAVVSHHDNIITYTNKPTKNCEVLKFSSQQL